MKSIKLISTLSLGIVGLWCLEGLTQEDKHRVPREFMRQKLTHANAILEGLTLENYGLVLTNSVSLKSMSITNVFVTLGNRQYQAEVTNFQAQVDALISAAKANELQQSTEAYTQVTKRCVSCHKQFRRDQFLRSQLQSK
jgi:hypothetical protein